MPDAAPAAQDLWLRARDRFRARDYAGAAELLAPLVERGAGDEGPPMREVRLQYGVTLLRLKRTEEGVAQLRLAVELDPANPRAHEKLGVGLGRLGQDLEALPCLERAAAMAPDNAEYQWRVGEQYRRLGRSEEARAAFQRSLALDPGYRRAADGLAALGARRGGWLKRLARAARRVLGR